MVVSSLWHKDVPLKIVLFAWRLFKDRLPTKDNLLRRVVNYHYSKVCVAGVVLLNSLLIYSYIVIFLGQFDIISTGG